MTTRHGLLLACSPLFLCSGLTNHNLAYLILGLRKGNELISPLSSRTGARYALVLHGCRLGSVTQIATDFAERLA
jgi:hypothetical protein